MMDYAVLFIAAWVAGALCGIGFQKREDEHIISMLRAKLSQNIAYIDLLNKKLGEKQ